MSPQVQQTLLKMLDYAAAQQLAQIIRKSPEYSDLVPLANRVLAPLAECHKEAA